MAVTLPVVLLILDVYPLGRLTPLHRKAGQGFRAWFTPEHRGILVEKVPFLLLSVVSSVITVYAQQMDRAIVPLWAHSFTARFFISMKSLCYYLLKMLWPADLVPLYPFPTRMSFGIEYVGSFLLVVVITTLGVILWRKKQKVLLTVWLYYAVTLLPVLGIIQTGGHEVAFRYTYLPMLGPFLLFGLLAGKAHQKACERKDIRKPRYFMVYPSLAVFIILLSFMSVRQESVWKDSISLWTHEINRFPSLHLAYDSRAEAYADRGKYREALEDLKISRSINPRYPATYFRFGMVYERTGQYLQALQSYHRTLELSPGFEPARKRKGSVYQMLLKDFETRILSDPEDVTVYIDRGSIHALMENYDNALQDYNRAIRVNPRVSTAYFNRGLVYINLNQYEQAIADLDLFLDRNPRDAQAYYHRALVYEKAGDRKKARIDLQLAAELGSAEAKNYLNNLEQK
jgi:tetratricopeptide (TPR) repeat protein